VSLKADFAKMLALSKKSLRSMFSEMECRQIEEAFLDYPNELITFTVRHMHNAILSEEKK